MARPIHAVQAALLVLVAGLVVACGGADSDRPDPAGGGLGGASPSLPSTDTGACTDEGGQKGCSVTIHQSTGIVSCFRGVQFCVDGRWSECQEQ